MIQEKLSDVTEIVAILVLSVCPSPIDLKHGYSLISVDFIARWAVGALTARPMSQQLRAMDEELETKLADEHSFCDPIWVVLFWKRGEVPRIHDIAITTTTHKN